MMHIVLQTRTVWGKRGGGRYARTILV